MNFQWREGVYQECALYEELIRDDGKVLGCIMRFFEENCPTYAMTGSQKGRPGSTLGGGRGHDLKKDAKPTLTLTQKP